MSIEIDTCDPRSPIGMALIEESSNDQIMRYGRDGGLVLEKLASAESVFAVAKLDGQPAGCGAVVFHAPEVGELSRIFVTASARRNGVASAILGWLERDVRGRYQRLVLETGTKQPESIKLYEAHGYTSIEPWGDGEPNPLVRCYEKWLND